MATNKRKTTTAVVASVAAAVLLLGGTFAWTSLSQMAKNESTGIVNVGGRLHDDFNGKNKDVYVENFTDPYNGGQPIYARVRLDEYMEVGSEAGKLDENGDYAADRKAVSVVDGATIDDVDSWSTHKPVDNCAECYEDGTLCKFHEHWKWEMGGSTTFMPTFNKDKDSLEADVNGTYQGTDATDKIYYDDYVEYTTDATNTDKVYSEEGTAHYDNDTDKEANTVEGQYTAKNETHYAKETAIAEVITMEQWLSEDTENGGKAGAPGNYWVYDTDGWAYWANPIMPGEATGLLLSNIEMTSNPGEKCYYAINVVGQFATVGDWEQFGVDEEDEDYPSTNAITLLTTASQNVPTVTVTNLDDVTLVNRGDEVIFSATSGVGGVSTLADDEYEWVVLDEERKKSETSTIEDNGDGTATLKVGVEEFSAGLYIAARSKNHGGAVGLSAVAVQLYTVTVTEQNNTTLVKAGKTLQFSAAVIDNGTGEAETSGVTWSVDSTAGSTIDEDGVLTIHENETASTVLTVTATSKNGGFFETYTVTVADKYVVTISQANNATVVFHGEPLQFTAEVTKNGAADTSGAIWEVIDGSGTTAIDENGLLTIDENETQAATLTVTATSKADSEVKATYLVTVAYKYDVCRPGIVIEADSFTADNVVLAPEAELNGTKVTDVVWTIAGNTDSNTRLENGNLYLGENETAAELTLNARNANGKGSQQLSLKYEMKLVFFRSNNFSNVYDTIEDGANRASDPWGDNMTCQIRVCRTNGTIIDGATMTFEVNGEDVTEQKDGNCTNGFIEAGAEADSVKDGHDYWWAWTPNTNTATVTIRVTYGESTFEATIW